MLLRERHTQVVRQKNRLANMEGPNYLRKFKLLFKQVFDGNIMLREDSIERILQILQDMSDNSPRMILTNTPGFSDMIYECLPNIKKEDITMRVFFLELVTLLLCCELQFTKMKSNEFHRNSVEYCAQGSFDTDMQAPALHIVSIKLAAAHLNHYSGLDVLIIQKAWECILKPGIINSPVQVLNAATAFVSKMAWKLSTIGMESKLQEVIEFIVKPIVNSDYINIQDINTEMDKKFRENILIFLKALLAILNETELILADNKVIPILKHQFLLELNLQKILQTTRCNDVISTAVDCLTRLYVGIHQNLLFSKKVDEFCNIIVAYHHNHIVRLLCKGSLPHIIDYIIQWTVYWNKVENSKAIKKSNLEMPLTFERNGQRLELVNQLTINLMVPMLVYRKVSCPGSIEDLIDTVTIKMSSTVTEHIFSTSYALRQLLLSTTANTQQSAILTIKELSRLKGVLHKNQAAKLFASLYYVLETFVMSNEAGNLILSEDALNTANDVQLLSCTLSAIKMLLKDHNITWYDIVEIVSLQEKLLDLLKHKKLQTLQIVQVLDLIDICVKKFLSPNMTLLVDNKQGSTLTEIGAIVTTYTQNEEWEIRDSALNLLLSCTELAFVKYIPFQNVIMENQLMLLATHVALTDSDFYSQGTALKCLAMATKIEEIWQEVVARNSQIHSQLIWLARNHTEGLVRKEAVNVLSQIYITKTFPDTLQNVIYEVMVTAAINDLHWEVQLTALKFWKYVIQNQLNYRGMLDGKFPTVTFSKEKRKIIKLNKTEITRILTSTLNYLSSIGGLTVLLECMNDVSHIEVMDQAHSITAELVEILDKYELTHIQENMVNEQAMDIKEESEDMVIDLSFATLSTQCQEQVIDTILNTYQSDLIMQLHDSYSSRNYDEFVTKKHHRKPNVLPNTFLKTFRETDYTAIIKTKKNWDTEIGSLDALLDELLCS